MRKITLIFIVALIVVNCQQSNSEIAGDRVWKAGEGNLLGDFITFSQDKEKGLYVDNDTIYLDGKPKALLISTSYNVDHYIMKVNSIDHKQSSTYYDKGRAK